MHVGLTVTLSSEPLLGTFQHRRLGNVLDWDSNVDSHSQEIFAEPQLRNHGIMPLGDFFKLPFIATKTPQMLYLIVAFALFMSSLHEWVPEDRRRS